MVKRIVVGLSVYRLITKYSKKWTLVTQWNCFVVVVVVTIVVVVAVDYGLPILLLVLIADNEPIS